MRFRNHLRRALAICWALALIVGMTGNQFVRAQQPQAAIKPLDFSSVAVMGDSLSHSFHDGVLHVDAQNQNYLMLLSQQIGFELRQALIAEPGFGTRFSLKDASKPTKPLDTNSFLNLTLPPVPQSQGRVDPSLRVNNFAIGGAKVRDIINDRPSANNPNSNIYTSLGIPWLSDNPPIVRSQLEFVEATKPTVAILFIGGNDALGAAFNSDLSLVTPPDQFLADYNQIVQRTKATGAQLILVTVPEVTSIAAFIQGRDLPFITRIPMELITQRTSIQPDDFVTLRAFGSIVNILLMNGQGPVPEDQILRKKMAKKISKMVKKYNDGIKKIAKKESYVLVELNEFLAKGASKDGFVIPGVATLTTKYFGGVASFDGVHITATANAVLANAFLDAINKATGTSYPMVDVAAVAKADPQVPKPTTTIEPAAVSVQQWIEALPEFAAAGRALEELFGGKAK